MRHEAELFSRTSEIFQKVDQKLDPYPSCIEIYPTDICNQRCLYCFHGGEGFGKERDIKKFMQVEDYAVLFKEMTNLNINTLSIAGGGEPFMFKGIVDVIDQAIANNLRVRIVTNGNFISSEAIDKILQCEEIRFSVDTPDPETYSKMRKVSPRLHQRTLDNITKLVEQKKQRGGNVDIGSTCIIGPDNAAQLIQFADLMLGQLGIDKVVFKHDIYGEFAADESSRAEINSQLNVARERYGDKVEIRSELPDFKTGFPCVVPHFKSAINPYGELYSCCLGAQPKEINGYKLENIADSIRKGKTNPLEIVWKESRGTRLSMLKQVACTSCNFTDRNINLQYADRSTSKN